MLHLPVTYLRLIHDDRSAEFESTARENELLAVRLAAVHAEPRGLRIRIGHAIARIGLLIANEEVCALAD